MTKSRPPDRRPRAGYARVVSELEGECASTVREVGRLADESGVKHEARLIKSRRPGRAVTGVAEEVRADCVIVGSSGFSPMDRLLLGGVRGEVLRRGVPRAGRLACEGIEEKSQKGSASVLRRSFGIVEVTPKGSCRRRAPRRGPRRRPWKEIVKGLTYFT